MKGALLVLLAITAPALEGRSQWRPSSSGDGTAPVRPDWRYAAPGWDYEFPRDHYSHPEFKTEWWYFTGNLFDQQQRRYGFELTFFREGIISPNQRAPDRSRFIVDDLKFAHFTVTDVAGRKFRFEQKASRGAFGEAGFDRGDHIAWIEDWSLRLLSNGEFVIAAKTTEAELELNLTTLKPPIIHGKNGVSVKAAGPNHASQYYSLTRLATTGTLRLGGNEMTVAGESWFDHEWATNQLAPGQVGWDWLCLQFKNGTELMLYQMRLRDGSRDLASSGTFIAADGKAVHLHANDFSFTPIAHWKSEKTKADYPVAWRVAIPSQGLQFEVQPALREQELALLPLAYWEGAVDARGEKVNGVGYLELTGYAGPLETLTR